MALRLLWSLIGFLCCFQVGFSQNPALDQEVNIEFAGESLEAALAKLETQSGIRLAFLSRHMPESSSISGAYLRQPIRYVLDDILEPYQLTYQEQGSLVLVVPVASQKSLHFTISGYIRDSQTGEPIAGVAIYEAASKKGVLSNDAGFFSLRLPAGEVKLVVSMLGYAVYAEHLVLASGERRNVDLIPSLEFGTVEIRESDIDELSEMGGASTIHLPMEDLDLLPALLGEPDVISSLKLYPGVHSGGDGSGGMYVRGGGPDQNLVLFDGVPIYNSSHLFGLFSIFNADAVRDVSLVKGGFPARYGGRLSSVVDVQMREGNEKGLGGSANLGLSSARLLLEGPILSENTTFLLSGRRTLLEPYWALLNKASEGDGGNTVGYSFLDLQGKIRHRFGKNRLTMSGYLGGDYFSSGYYIDTSDVQDRFSFGLTWGNRAGVLRWQREWSPKVFGDVKVYTSQYSYNSDSRAEVFFQSTTSDVNGLQSASEVKDYGARAEFDILPAASHLVKVGASSTLRIFNPETYIQVVDQGGVPSENRLAQGEIRSMEHTLFAEDMIRWGKSLRFNVGGHFSLYQTDSVSFTSLQPRVSGRLLLPWNAAIRGDFSQMTQYLHLLSNSGVGLPTDLWVPATARALPQEAWQVGGGYEQDLDQGAWRFVAEGYYKHMRNLIDYQTGVNFLGRNEWEDVIVTDGVGQAYGMELLLRKTTGRWRGWLGYTLSKTEREFAGINGGQPFPYKYDRRHDVSISLLVDLSEHWTFGTNWVYGTGTAITFPKAVYFAPSTPALGFWTLNDGRDFNVIVDYGERNGFRLPAYHRLDLNFSRVKKHDWGETSWNFGLYNAYNRRNPFFLFLRADYSDDPNAPEIRARKMSLLPILPAVNFGLKF